MPRRIVKKEAVGDAALYLFATKGMALTTVKEIAVRARDVPEAVLRMLRPTKR